MLTSLNRPGLESWHQQHEYKARYRPIVKNAVHSATEPIGQLKEEVEPFAQQVPAKRKALREAKLGRGFQDFVQEQVAATWHDDSLLENDHFSMLDWEVGAAVRITDANKDNVQGFDLGVLQIAAQHEFK
jgi:hypothetical protein